MIGKVEKVEGREGGVEENGVPNAAKHVHKRAPGDTYGGKIATLSQNGNVEKNVVFFSVFEALDSTT